MGSHLLPNAASPSLCGHPLVSGGPLDPSGLLAHGWVMVFFSLLLRGNVAGAPSTLGSQLYPQLFNLCCKVQPQPVCELRLFAAFWTVLAQEKVLLGKQCLVGVMTHPL